MAHRSMIQAILYQALKEDRKAFTSYLPTYRKRPLQQDGHSGDWSSGDLLDIVKVIVSLQAYIICILDGLDESADEEKFAGAREVILLSLAYLGFNIVRQK